MCVTIFSRTILPNHILFYFKNIILENITEHWNFIGTPHNSLNIKSTFLTN